MPTFLAVSGSPGSGKTELATPLAQRLSLPLLAKDTIKEVLAEQTDPAELTLATSQTVGALAFDVLYALAADCHGGAVLDAAWSPTFDPTRLGALPGDVIEVHAACPPDLARSRYLERAAHRHWIHLDAERGAARELWSSSTSGPLGLSTEGPAIVVDTTGPVDLDALLIDIRAHVGWTAPDP